MASRKVGQRPCLAKVKVHPDFLSGYQQLLAYWKHQGISPRYLNPDESMAFNCGQIGEDLLHTDEVRREEACLAMKGFFPYPLATQIKRYWHFRDDPLGGYEKAWDPVEEAAEIIGQVLESMRSGQSKYDPAQGDLCHYLFWPRLDWQRSALARKRYGRKEADRQLAEWRAHPDCGDLNCKECAARYISLEPYTEETFEEGGEEILPTYARTSQLQRLRLPGDITAFPELDPVADEVLGQEGYRQHSEYGGFLSQKDLRLLDLLFIHEMTPQELAIRSGKLLKTIQNRSSQILSRMETQLSKCILSRMLELFFFDQNIHFSDHHPDIADLIHETLRATRLNEGLLSPVTRSIFLHPPMHAENLREMELLLTKRMPVPFFMVATLSIGMADRSTIDPVYTRFQQAIIGDKGVFSVMLVAGRLGEWLLKQMIHLANQTDFFSKEELDPFIGWYFNSGPSYFPKSVDWIIIRNARHEVDNCCDFRKGLRRGKHIFLRKS